MPIVQLRSERHPGRPHPGGRLFDRVNWYTQSACASPNFGTPQLTTYAGYDTSGNQLMTVDAFGTAHASFYGSGGTSGKNGCTLSGAPAIYNTNWTAGAYTTCTVYDGTSNLPTSSSNAFGQTTRIAYDAGQGDLPTSETDVNQPVTSLTSSYDPSGNLTAQTTEPNKPQFSFTGQATGYSTCSQSSSLPCSETTSNAALYSNAVAETFYDAEGRVTETRTPGPDSAGDTIQFTVYNDQQHSSFTSIPFEVASGSGWIDPNGATDKNGHTPTGTATFYDAMGRMIAVQDPLFNPPSVPGISCPSPGGNATTCALYELDTVNGDSNTYDATVSIDANDHVSESLRDVLGNTRYVRYASGNRVLRRSTTSSSTTMTVSPFGLEEHLYSGSGTNQFNTSYYLLDGQLIGDLNPTNTYFLLSDALGSVVSTINWAAGGAAVQGNQLFGPYGNGRYSAGNLTTAKGFTGQ